MLGRTITLHQDAVIGITLLYRPAKTDDLILSVSWLDSHVAVDLTADEMEALGKALTKGVKKVRKHQKKQAKDRSASLNTISGYALRGRRK